MIFFDIGATLIEGPDLAPARQLQCRLGLSDIQRRAIDRMLLTGAIHSREMLEDYVGAASQATAAACHAAVDEVWESQALGPRIVAGATELLLALRSERVPYAFISNIWAPYAEAFRRLFGELVDGCPAFLSFELGVAKPDPDIYRKAISMGPYRPADCVMVGDSYDNDMQPAIALGMKTVWLMHRPDKEKTFVEQMGSGQVPAPDLIVPSIQALSPPILTALTDSVEEVTR